MCNECQDRAYRRLYGRLNEFMKELDKDIKNEKNDARKVAMMSVGDRLEDLLARN